jgi:hypothetical protein
MGRSRSGLASGAAGAGEIPLAGGTSVWGLGEAMAVGQVPYSVWAVITMDGNPLP